MTENTADLEMPRSHHDRAEEIVRRHMSAAMGLGLVPIPIVDFLGLSAIAMDLLRSLAAEYGQTFSPKKAKTIISSLIGGGAGVAGTALFASLVKFVPIVGQTTGAVYASIVGG